MSRYLRLLSTINIQACPNHCEKCANKATCEICEENFALVDDVCITCPPGKYLSKKTCRGKFSKINET